MNLSRVAQVTFALSCLIAVPLAQTSAQTATKPYQPTVGQPGKDVVWVPSPEEMVERALDLAAVTPNDFVIDLGSGDGRNVISAAKRGARALGVEYNPDLVQLSRDNAAKAGVADRATFVQGDMFEADISKATVMALFLLPDNLRKLRDKLFNLRPGTRIVANTFGIEGWNADETKQYEDGCSSWCTIMLWIVPAKVAGTWKMSSGELTLTQDFQNISGTLGTTAIESGRLRGNEISFTAGGVSYSGRVTGDTIEGTSGDHKWTARRTPRLP
ncbi:MAG: methyltransferase domain-containing protein [Vicinamibacterales bacterium]